MKKSKVLLVFVLIIVIILGGVAIWLGLKLSREGEVEELPETGAGDTYFLCNGLHGTCSFGDNDFYVERKDNAGGTDAPCTTRQKDPDGVVVKKGPDPNRQVWKNTRDPKCKGGYSGECENKWDWASCQSCKNISIIGTPSSTSVTVHAYAWSILPVIKTEHTGNWETQYSYIRQDDSKVEFRFRIYDSSDNLIVEETILESDPEFSDITCAKTPNPTDVYQWGKQQTVGYRSYVATDKVYECNVEHAFSLSSTPLESEETYSVEVSSRLRSRPPGGEKDPEMDWRHPDMTISTSAGTVEYDIPYLDELGVTAPPTYRQLYNSTIDSLYTWADDTNNTCIRTFSLGAFGNESMTCQDLVSSTSLASITEDDIRSSDIETTLTTTISSENVSVSSAEGYEYYTNIPNGAFGTDGSSPYTNGAETTFTIPQGTENGSYYIAVMVSGTGASDPFESGCTSATSCSGSGDGCLITLDIGEGSCNCESVTRSPSDDDIAAGSYIAYTMIAADQNGTECLVDASDVNWSTTGDPALVEVSRDPEPVSGSTDTAANHHIIYQLPDTAAESTEYSVSAVVDALGQVAACANTFTVGGEPDPAFAAVKTSEMECINNNTAAQITYTIHVRNISDVEGTIEYVEDTYDSRFQSSWVGSITPSADSHTGNVIRWDNSDNGYTLTANDGASGGDDEIEFSYVVTVPSDYFGAYENGVFVPYQYRNHAIVQPEDQDQIELSVLVEITCDLPITPTGIFNNAVNTGLLGVLMLVIGGFLVRMHSFTYKFLAPIEGAVTSVSNVIGSTYKSIKERFKRIKESIYDRLHLTKKERFEKEAVRKADRKK